MITVGMSAISCAGSFLAGGSAGAEVGGCVCTTCCLFTAWSWFCAACCLLACSRSNSCCQRRLWYSTICCGEMICVGAELISSTSICPCMGAEAWLTTAASGIFVASTCNGCPHFLQNLASSRLGALHDGQNILSLLYGTTIIVYVVGWLPNC